jgi:dethiobiotin synthetase
MKGLFITGTDTDSGKTYLACSLARVLIKKGYDVGVMKPVASGCNRVEQNLLSEDADLLRASVACSDDYEDVCPCRFELPLGPTAAARISSGKVLTSKIMSAFQRLRSKHDFMIVEGVGGLAVPLNSGIDVAGLAVEMELPLLIVAADRLGVINHTCLTAAYAQQRGLTIAGIILNQVTADSHLSCQSNSVEISKCGLKVSGKIGYCSDLRDADKQMESILKELSL